MRMRKGEVRERERERERQAGRQAGGADNLKMRNKVGGGRRGEGVLRHFEQRHSQKRWRKHTMSSIKIRDRLHMCAFVCAC